jgi:uncharacterized membrane protein YjdF
VKWFLWTNTRPTPQRSGAIIEAITAEIVSPDLGAAYLGTQGDIWDAQKDAFVAFIGAAVAMTVTWLRVCGVAHPPADGRH